ncbi:Uncharacterized protein PBTT_09983 [Plasmodiophora brassicae]|nr:hypothetical protein PBRA_001829 [Plasmodiophora brassicae]
MTTPRHYQLFSLNRTADFHQFDKRPAAHQLGVVVGFVVASGALSLSVIVVPLAASHTDTFIANMPYLLVSKPVTCAIIGLWTMSAISTFTKLPASWRRTLPIMFLFATVALLFNVATFYMGFFPVPFSTVFLAGCLMPVALPAMYFIIPEQWRREDPVFRIHVKITLVNLAIAASFFFVYVAFRLLFIFLRFNVALQSCSTILLQLIRYTWLQINARLSHITQPDAGAIGSWPCFYMHAVFVSACLDESTTMTVMVCVIASDIVVAVYHVTSLSMEFAGIVAKVKRTGSARLRRVTASLSQIANGSKAVSKNEASGRGDGDDNNDAVVVSSDHQFTAHEFRRARLQACEMMVLQELAKFSAAIHFMAFLSFGYLAYNRTGFWVIDTMTTEDFEATSVALAVTVGAETVLAIFVWLFVKRAFHVDLLHLVHFSITRHFLYMTTAVGAWFINLIFVAYLKDDGFNLWSD